MTPRRGLGKGLSSLLGDDANFDSNHGRRSIVKTSHLKKSSYQPRSHFNEDELVNLAGSIQTHGVLQPILVREIGEKSFEIVAGERRWRAAKIAGLEEVPVVIMDLTELQALEIALLENIQRQDLSPIEEAEGYRRLLDGFNHTQESLSKVLGKSRSHIANLLRLLTLPEDVKAAIQDEQLTMGHAKLLLGAENPSELAKQVVANNLSIQETNEFVKLASPRKRRQARASASHDPEIANLVSQFEELTGMRVDVQPTGARTGKIVFKYNELSQLDTFLQQLSRSQETAQHGSSPKVWSV